MIRSSLLDSLPGVVHAFTTRAEYVPPPPPARSRPAALRPVLEALGLPGWDVAMLDQVHGARALALVAAGARWPVGAGDALVSTLPGTLIYVRAADCVPILVAGSRGVAAIHAGWRGTAAGIVRAGVELLLARTGHAPGELVAAVGPAIGPCCYEVGPELVEQLSAIASPERFLRERPGRRPAADLRALDLHLLGELGIREVDLLPGCTCCDLRFHSYRRDGARAGRQAALIGLRP